VVEASLCTERNVRLHLQYLKYILVIWLGLHANTLSLNSKIFTLLKFISDFKFFISLKIYLLQ